MGRRKIDYRAEQLVHRVEPQLRKAIEHEAFKRDRSLSWMIKHILVSWLQDQEMRRQPQAVPAE